ncbi:unnamed protein product [Camellia sinensis]
MPNGKFPLRAVPIPIGPELEIPTHVGFETAYRVNMGGQILTPKNDTLWRIWESDQPFLINSASARNVSVNPGSIEYPSGVSVDIAPNWVYATAQEMADANVTNQKFNISWAFKVDEGFDYLVRLHFCDIVSVTLYSLVFNVYMNNQSAMDSFDISRKTMALASAYFIDFVVNVSMGSKQILVQVGPPNLRNIPTNAIVNGLEIKNMRNPRSSDTKVSTGSFASMTPSLRLGRVIAFSEICEATRSFDENLVLGVGGFGKVYKGVLENGVGVAVKGGNPRSQQGLVEFRTEIKMLSKLRHRHLVSLIGYCEGLNEMILVYEFMVGGPLRKHLYGSNLPPLTWKQRLEICIGAPKGLHYLHTGAAESIIHRDVKTTNILLDENLAAKSGRLWIVEVGPNFGSNPCEYCCEGKFRVPRS